MKRFLLIDINRELPRRRLGKVCFREMLRSRIVTSIVENVADVCGIASVIPTTPRDCAKTTIVARTVNQNRTSSGVSIKWQI